MFTWFPVNCCKSCRIGCRRRDYPCGGYGGFCRYTYARATGASLGWPLPPDLTDAALEQQSIPTQVAAEPGVRRHQGA